MEGQLEENGARIEPSPDLRPRRQKLLLLRVNLLLPLLRVAESLHNNGHRILTIRKVALNTSRPRNLHDLRLRLLMSQLLLGHLVSPPFVPGWAEYSRRVSHG